jgi:hypothetical protein
MNTGENAKPVFYNRSSNKQNSWSKPMTELNNTLASTPATISKYDRQRGSLQDIAMFTRPSTIKNVQNMTGKSETFVVETCRYEELGGDYIFIECVDENGVTRICLPPRVANVIASQRDSLTSRRRSAAATRVAKARMERGELPGFMKSKKKSKRKKESVQQ